MNANGDTKQRKDSAWKALLPLVFQINLHALAVVVVSILLGAIFFDGATTELVWTALLAGAYTTSTLTACLLHVAIAACLWGLACLIFALAQELRHGRSGTTRVLRLNRGTVITETLIVFPVALLLIFVLAQLALNNMAGVMANAAVFQAARTNWIWQPEYETGRMGLPADMELATEHARVQAAAVMTPVAPGDYLDNANLPEKAELARAVFVGSQIPIPGQDSGRWAKSQANYFATVGQEGGNSFTNAFDTHRFIERSARKFTWAYRAVEVEVDTIQEQGQEKWRLSLKYHHLCVIPLVGSIFGERLVAAGGVDGYFTVIERTVIRSKQVQPSAEYPQGTPIRSYNYF
jgi:hypothetical protein